VWYHAFKKYFVLQFPGRQFEVLAPCWDADRMEHCVHTCVPSPGIQKCFPCVDRVLIKGFWTYWLKETMVTSCWVISVLLQKSLPSPVTFWALCSGACNSLWTGEDWKGRGRREGNVGSTGGLAVGFSL
jgi:hypothetical protein